MYYKYYFIAALCIICFVGCLPSGQYMSKKYMTHHYWHSKDAATFKVNINDTSKGYYMNFLMQHGQDYNFSNIWCQLITKYPNGSIDSTLLEIPLALASGQWMGTSANSMVEHTMNLAPNAGIMHFTDKGIYEFKLLQYMRVDTLQDVEYVGLQLEKLEQ
jgi:gliding motility-associated lipoprotein GldH